MAYLRSEPFVAGLLVAFAAAAGVAVVAAWLDVGLQAEGCSPLGSKR